MKVWQIVLLVICGLALLIPATAFFWEWDFDNYPLNKIAVSHPFYFSKTDTLVQNTLTEIEEKGMTKGQIDPYFDRHGNLEDRYNSLAEAGRIIHELALLYPHPSREDTSKAFRDQVVPTLNKAQAFSTNYLLEHHFYHKYKWLMVLFYLSFYCLIYVVIRISKKS